MTIYNYSLWVAVVVLSVKTAFLLGISGMDSKLSLLFSVFTGLLLGALLIVFSPFQDILDYILDEYTFWGALAVAALLIYLGVQAPGKDGCRSMEKGVTGWRRWRRYIIALLPCPFCLLALALGVITVATMEEGELGIIALKVTIAFTGMVWLVSLLFQKISVRLKINQVFNQTLVCIGITTLLLSLTVPNITRVMQDESSIFAPLVIENPRWAALIALVITILMLSGYLYQKRKAV